MMYFQNSHEGGSPYSLCFECNLVQAITGVKRMIKSLLNAFSGMKTNITKQESVSDNLANLSTPGFRGSRVISQELGGASAIVETSSNQGASIVQTGNALDLAVIGDGYFKLTGENGADVYTRAGNFNIDGNGNMLHSSGAAVSPAIQIPQGNTDVQVARDGTVSSRNPNTGIMATAGQLGVVSFQNPQALKRVGGNLLTVSEDSGPPVPVGDGVDIRAGYLESSNVSIIDEIQSLIFARAGFDANANVAKASDEMLGSLLDIKK